ncbi:DUF2141 domain-containing protein [Massilia antarctica]|uniref:DUF2141 domain-containing protein n=1 Tax=Massilia antarctica TaxID=2765360 RepID=UPI0006BB7606|nr:DUF2141 domain-containing protein [Massilia sp. H27-R4]MCY0912761.1 DUF2141 domain-containing protein [Massilia sp. H27-R4]CUI03832.1 hypothetical protein BN2497_2441 [Janthinobacterium sp. CG23_2]CUU27618.1 hypothetical protein BN3177_2441 [Janthinobacterium sp. CG23_2]
MRHLLATAFCSAALLTTSLAGAADLTIRIDDVRSDDGTVMLALYNSAGGFLKHAMGSADAKAAKGSTTIVVKDLPAGPYAFAIYHDANGNGKMDANMMGMPTEDYAFSNNALGKMGPPKFDDAMFTLPATGLNATVSLKH